MVSAGTWLRKLWVRSVFRASAARLSSHYSSLSFSPVKWGYLYLPHK